MTSSQRASALLIGALRDPAGLPSYSPEDWDLLLRVARAKRLLGRIQSDLERLGLLDAMPARANNQLRAARNLVRHRQTLLTWELDRVLWALEGLDVPVVVLKGAAYVIAGLPPAAGRFFADLDLLVPRARIAEVEARLLEHGWLRTTLSPYDDRYYRVWMHEIPPLRHRERENEIDIHHAILPLTSRLGADLDMSLLLARSQPVSGSRARVLAPHDLVLHALVHLFFEGDPAEGFRLRDLVDVADLLGHFGQEPGFWEGLVPRAEQLGLGRALYYGLRYAQGLLGVGIPESVMRAATRAAPTWPVRSLMDRLVPLAILPEHPDQPRHRAALARWLMYARAHWLRMPSWLLARHLGYKTWLRMRRIRRQVAISPRDLKRL